MRQLTDPSPRFSHKVMVNSPNTAEVPAKLSGPRNLSRGPHPSF